MKIRICIAHHQYPSHVISQETQNSIKQRKKYFHRCDASQFLSFRCIGINQLKIPRSTRHLWSCRILYRNLLKHMFRSDDFACSFTGYGALPSRLNDSNMSTRISSFFVFFSIFFWNNYFRPDNLNSSSHMHVWYRFTCGFWIFCCQAVYSIPFFLQRDSAKFKYSHTV